MKGTVIVRSAQAPQVVQASLSRHRGAHGSQTRGTSTPPVPGPGCQSSCKRALSGGRVAQGRLSQQGKTTLSVSSSSHRPLRVVVAGQPGEPTLMSRVLRALG